LDDHAARGAGALAAASIVIGEGHPNDSSLYVSGSNSFPYAKASSSRTTESMGTMTVREVSLDASTQGEYTKSKPRLENRKHFNDSKAQSQILPLRSRGLREKDVAGIRKICVGLGTCRILQGP
jgi:hypothetical protein